MTKNCGVLASYLRARRSLVQPEDVGLPRESNRRVSGLRRQEVAALADISFDYYLRLEQGRHQQPSDQVLASLGRALLLDEDAQFHLFRMARISAGTSRTPLRPMIDPDDNMSRLLEFWSHTPAVILDRNQDVVRANRLAVALGRGHLNPGNNLVISTFDQVVRDTAADWEDSAIQSVAALRYHGDPRDPRLREIVGVLSHRDPDFRRIWARHDARPMRSGTLRSDIERVGLVDLCFQNFAIPGHTGHTLSTFFAESDSRGAVALTSLAEHLLRTSLDDRMPRDLRTGALRAAG